MCTSSVAVKSLVSVGHSPLKPTHVIQKERVDQSKHILISITCSLRNEHRRYTREIPLVCSHEGAWHVNKDDGGRGRSAQTCEDGMYSFVRIRVVNACII